MLKDNMEMAIRHNQAEKGGYDQKKDFVEYFLCNGPELDTDTLMYYRERCYQDPIYLEIAEVEFSDMETVVAIRESKYGKKSDLEDCFTQPCNYLGPLSSTIGIMGDSNNFRTMPNIFSVLLGKAEAYAEKNKKEQEKKEGKTSTDSSSSSTSNSGSSSSSSSSTDSSKKSDFDKGQESAEAKAEKASKDSMEDVVSAWGHIRTHLTNLLLPDIRSGMQVMYDSMYDHAETFAKECHKAGLTHSADIGDRHAIARADQISTATKVNTYSQLGDCARLWEHMRRFNPYDISQNKKGRISDGKIVANRNMNGTSIDSTPNPSVMSNLTRSEVRAAANAGNKMAQIELELREMGYVITLEEATKLTDLGKKDEDRFAYFTSLYGNYLDRKYPINKSDPNVTQSVNYRKRREEFAHVVEMLNQKKQQVSDIKYEIKTETTTTTPQTPVGVTPVETSTTKQFQAMAPPEKLTMKIKEDDGTYEEAVMASETDLPDRL